MILELDVGNTRIKWRQLQAGSGKPLRVNAVASVADLATGEAGDTRPAMVRLCSVRAPETVSEIKAWVRETWSLEVQEAGVTRSCAGVTNHYADLGRLGVDRWLAMIAAFHRRPGGCVIVDSGTAMTVDIVADDGQHQGGYIVPGSGLVCRVLEEHTRIRLDDSRTQVGIVPGHSTDEAVRHGALAMQVALVEKALRYLPDNTPQLNLYLTGGDAELLAQHLDLSGWAGEAESAARLREPELVSGLVLDGLAYACPGPDGD